MFGNNYIQENLDGYEPAFIPNELQNFMMPGFDNYAGDLFQRDFQNFPLLSDLDGIDTTNLMQFFDQAMQNIPDEMKQWLPMPFDYVMPTGEGAEPVVVRTISKPTFHCSNDKIGTITLEERRLKVQKYLEKRKKRNFRKKISYMCRKKVADQRVRVKGRFVSKVQAEAILGDKSNKVSEV